MSKVLFHICNSVYPYVVGGMEIFNYYLIREISHRLDVAVFSGSEYDFDHIERFNYHSVRPTKLFDGFQLFILLLFHRDISLVVFSYSQAHPLLWLANCFAVILNRRKYVAIIHHGMVPDRKGFSLLSFFFRHASRVIAVSDDIKSNYDKLFDISCTVIPPLVPFKHTELTKMECRLEYKLPLDATIICQIGTIKEMKNPQTIVRAVAAMNSTEIGKYNPHIVFAGNCVFDSFTDLVQVSGVADRVHLLGAIPKEDVCKILKASDYYLIASDYEGTSVSLLEAMYNNLPIIASDVRGIKDMVSHRHNALLFPAKDSDALLDCLKEYLDSPELRMELSNAARKSYNKKYNYDGMLDSYFNIFSELTI